MSLCVINGLSKGIRTYIESGNVYQEISGILLSLQQFLVHDHRAIATSLITRLYIESRTYSEY